MTVLSNLIIPIMVITIIAYGVLKRINVYDAFVAGVKDSFGMITTLFPTFLAMILGVNVLINSGFIQNFTQKISHLFTLINVPVEIVPMAIIRPISGSASLAIVNNIFQNYHPDSFLGLLSSVMQGATDTTFYVLTLYFGSIGIKKIRYALWAGLFADLVGIIASIIVVKMYFG